MFTHKGYPKRRRPSSAALLAGFLAWLVPLLCLSAPELPLVTEKNLEQGFSIEGQWRFQPGDNREWAALHFDDSYWGFYDIPGRWPGDGFPEHKQMAWYRLTLRLAPHALEHPDFAHGLGIQIGKLLSAYEIYANGTLIGHAGRLPPLAEAYWGEHQVHFLPRELIGPDGRLEIALRVWGGSDLSTHYWGGGAYGGPFKLGDYTALLVGEFSGSVISLMLCALFLSFGINHLYLYHRNRQLKLYLWFGLTSINVAVYSFMLTQWKFLLPVSFDNLKIIEFGSVFILPAVALQMIWALLGVQVRPWMRYFQMSFLIFLFLGLTNPWTGITPLLLNFFQIWALPVLAVIPFMLWKAMRAGNTEVRTMFLGLIVFGITCVNDICIDLLRIHSPRMIYYGFAAAMLAMAVSVDNRFTAMLNRLEREVAQHTEELREANFRLSLAARVDPLTDLLNRRGFIEDAEKEIQRVNRGSTSFALVLADIDHFKTINDCHGHSFGDQVLKRVAALLRQRLREVDIVGRWGGEEFIFILPETGAKNAAIVAEYLRQAVATAEFEHDGTPISFTMTFGIAIHQKGEHLDITVHRADTAMYWGKDAGRNQVVTDDYQGLSAIS